MNTITTWADSFGVWHAKVTLAVATPSDGLNSSSLRASARRAIRRELIARAPRTGLGDYRVRIDVVANDLGADNRLRSITYAERA